jgi:hypothetical protein
VEPASYIKVGGNIQYMVCSGLEGYYSRLREQAA